MYDNSLQDEALDTLSRTYYKILKVNLTADTYEDVKVEASETSPQKGFSPHLSQWLTGFAKTQQIHPGDRETYLLFANIKYLRREFLSGKTYLCCHYRRKIREDFRWVSLELIACPEYSEQNQTAFLYVRDVHNEFLSDFEDRDIVTGGLSHQGFLKQGTRLLLASPPEQEFAIVLFNIKGFKAINELYGSSGGDELLHQVYLLLKNSCLSPLLLARTEGDRFVCLIDRKNLDYDALPGICRTVFTRDQKTITVFIRCGIFLVEDKTQDLNTMCDYAKLAKNYILDEDFKPYAVFEKSMRHSYLLQSEIRGRLWEALDSQEFQVYYQPIFSAQTGKLISAEALTRWFHPVYGLIPPSLFIPILEESGHVAKVDSYVINKVGSFLRTRKEQGLPIVPVSVNLSRMDFYDSTMIDSILNDIRKNTEAGLDARFEITESAYVGLLERGGDIISSLRELGATLLLDDFGSGYSTFSTVRDYQFDIVKLDMGFVQKIGIDTHTKSIIHSLIDMFHHMGIKVIAEGVENNTQLDFLRRHDCDYIQGYLFSKPLPEKEFAQFLNRGDEDRGLSPLTKELTLTDLISVDILQQIQDAFSAMTGMAALTTDRHGVAVTKGSNFTDFCMKYTRTSALGKSRCEQCDKQGAELALKNGKSCAYQCHAGLFDYAAPIMANGEMIGCFIGGQVLPERKNPESFVPIALELGIPPEEYKKALQSVRIVEKEQIDSTAGFLYTIANILSSMAYSKYMLDLGNDMLQKKNLELDFLANYDKLTRLSNRHHIQEYFCQYEKSGKTYCVAIGDIDSFKAVNDTYGHSCGDYVLVAVSDIIQKAIEKNGVSCRWGGEEFLLLLPMEKPAALRIVEGIRQKIENTDLEYNRQSFRKTMTFGLACSDERDSMEKLITLADQRLYQGKNSGKNKVVAISLDFFS